nr:MAG TPA: hypothetical protein [Caudoviricetes sp.]
MKNKSEENFPRYNCSFKLILYLCGKFSSIYE